MNLNPPTEHQLLVFWVGIFVIVLLARILGSLARKVGQPSVIGELTAGILVGPSALGRLFPDVFEWLFPPDDVQTGMLFTVGWMGALFLLIVTGDETDLGLIKRLGRAAGIVSAGSLLVPMAAGLAVGFALPVDFLGGAQDRTVFALFFAAALSISSLPVIAKILGDMGFMRRDFGQLTLAAGMANDVVGWIVLGIVAGLAQAGSVELGAIATTVGGLLAFFLAAFTIGQWLLDFALRRIRLGNSGPFAGTGLILVFAFGAGSITQWLGVEAVLGAFVAGVLVGRSRLRSHADIAPIENLTSTFLAPVFFATAGLRVDLGLLAEGEVLLWAIVVVVVASLAKFLGSMVSAKMAGLPNREGMALGVGLNARGAMEIVIATVGLSLGVLNQASYTVVVLMALATSMAAPPVLRRVLRGWKGTEAEQSRLAQEERLAGNRLIRSERVMLPTLGGSNSIMAAQLIDLAWPKETPVGLVSVNEFDEAGIDVLRDVLFERTVDRRELEGDVIESLIAEMRLGYGVAVIGTAGPDNGGVLSSMAEELALRNPSPTVVVRRGLDVEGRLPPAYERVLLPVSGTPSSQAALEFGLNISAHIGTEAVLAHIVHDEEEDPRPVFGRATDVLMRGGQPPRPGIRLMDNALELADEMGARAVPVTMNSDSTAAGILEVGRLHSTDLVVVGATRRDIDGELFLGHTVERLVRDMKATLVIVVTPADHNPKTPEAT